MKATAFAESNIAATFDFAQKLVKSKDLTEVMQHQSDFLKSQVTTFQSQIKELGAAAQDVASKAAESVSKATKGRLISGYPAAPSRRRSSHSRLGR